MLHNNLVIIEAVMAEGIYLKASMAMVAVRGVCVCVWVGGWVGGGRECDVNFNITEGG